MEATRESGFSFVQKTYGYVRGLLMAESDYGRATDNKWIAKSNFQLGK